MADDKVSSVPESITSVACVHVANKGQRMHPSAISMPCITSSTFDIATALKHELTLYSALLPQ